MNTTRFKFEVFEQEKERLASLRKYEPLIEDADEDLHQLVKIAAYICQTPISLVNLIEANHTIFKAAVGTDMKGSPREISFCSRAIMGSGIMEIPDATLDDRFKNNPLVTGDTQIRFYAGSPLINKEGMNMGTLCVFDQVPKVLSAEQKEALETLSKMAVMVMENRKQAAIMHKGNLSAVIALENKVNELTKQIESIQQFLPVGVAAQVLPRKFPEAASLLKEMVLLQCCIRVSTAGVSTEIAFLPKLYELIARVIQTYNGTIHHFDGNIISAYFSEPLSTLPFEENALYCAFDLTEQADEFLRKQDTGSGLHLTACLHNGQVRFGSISLPNRFDFTLSGRMVEESKLMADAFIAAPTSVTVSANFLNKIKDIVNVNRKDMIKGKGMSLEVFEVQLAS